MTDSCDEKIHVICVMGNFATYPHMVDLPMLPKDINNLLNSYRIGQYKAETFDRCLTELKRQDISYTERFRFFCSVKNEARIYYTINGLHKALEMCQK
jgi:hypothetical protein